jgi:hypothetical protein
MDPEERAGQMTKSWLMLARECLLKQHRELAMNL